MSQFLLRTLFYFTNFGRVNQHETFSNAISFAYFTFQTLGASIITKLLIVEIH